MLWSDNLGRSWKRFGPERNVSRAMAGQWSVLPRMLQLPSGELLLSGGRPGIFVWVGGRDEGREWRRVNICAEHNAGLTPALRAGWGFEPTLATLEPWAAPVPNEHDGPCCEPPDLAPKALSPSDLTRTCATLLAGTHPNCTENGAWCQTTGYTSVMPLDKDRSQFVIAYDRLANGWGGPP